MKNSVDEKATPASPSTPVNAKQNAICTTAATMDAMVRKIILRSDEQIFCRYVLIP